VGLALGPPGSGAAIEVPHTEAIFSGILHVAVTVPPGISARLLSPAVAGQVGEQAASGTVAPFLEKMHDAVDYMAALVRRRLPASVVRKQFLPQIIDKTSVVVSRAFGTRGRGSA
jgi:hypothetical protein